MLEDLQSYDSAQTWYPYWEWGLARSRRMIMPFPTSGRSANAIFEVCTRITFLAYTLYLMRSPLTRIHDLRGKNTKIRKTKNLCKPVRILYVGSLKECTRSSQKKKKKNRRREEMGEDIAGCANLACENLCFTCQHILRDLYLPW